MCFALPRRSSAPTVQQDDARGVSAFPLGPAGPSGFSDFCSHRWCGPVLGDIRNIGFGYVSQGRLPSYLAIERTIRSSLFLGSYVMVLGTQHGLLVPQWIQTVPSNLFSAYYC